MLVRAGSTEAAVDFSRLAGLVPAGVTCAVMNDDGDIARLSNLADFGRVHGLRIGAIADLIAHRRRTERQVDRVLETPFESVYGGRFRMVIYRNILDRTEHVALVHGEIDAEQPTLVRMHQVDMVADMLGHVAARQDLLPRALSAISAYPGAGVAVFLRNSDPGHLSQKCVHPGQRAPDAILRDYGIGAQILLDLGVRDIILLTTQDARPRLPGFEGYGLRNVDWRRL